jgi:D-alanyl-D-alanine carboxypeptidase (penicillin-binding protein 5/6)
MLTNLLSLYITSVIGDNTTSAFNLRKDPSPSIVKTASANLSDIEESKFIPLKNPEFLAPIINSTSSLAMDLKTGVILFEDNSHDRLQIASLTKLMTATIIIEENNVDEIVTVSKTATQETGSTMYLVPEETITVQNLLYGLIVHSSNDAALALAEHNAGTVDSFVEKMNKKALALGLLNTHFSNPIGLDNKNNYSSAYDLAKLSQYVYQKKLIKEIAATSKIKVTSSDDKYTHNLESTNELLGTDFIKFKGLKTGTTDQAGLCIISVAENENGNEILTVLLHSPDRFRETKILADWVFRAYNWQR